MTSLDDARGRLKAFDPLVRRRALDELIQAERTGQIRCAPFSDQVNLHCHTFFSYNGYGHSPTSLTWLAKEKGWHTLGTVDFDVLDGVDETLEACDLVGVRGVAGLETRAYLPEFAARECNSPGEPGIVYFVGIGFADQRCPAIAAALLDQMRRGAARRNRDVAARVNAYLDPVTIDYDRDALPLTPSGNVTERHLLIAYDEAARQRFPDRGALLGFWASKLHLEVTAVDAFLGDVPFPHDAIRAKLMKQGGVGYVQPDAGTFPPLDDVVRAIVACGALPTYPWLDGLSEGEQRLEELMQLLISKGMVALAIIPDRNWNVPDPDLRAAKVSRLRELVEMARSLDLPLIAGTEMNKAGQKLVDDLEAEPLRPFRRDFIAGADFVYGHTVMQRAFGSGYQSRWAQAHLPTRGQRNAFYLAVGRLVESGPHSVARLARLGPANTPSAMLSALE